MSQMKLSVGSALKTSIQAVDASGITSMSELLIAFQPRMDEPSKPRPSVKSDSLYSVRVVVKCCQVPRMSQNLKSISLIPCSLISAVMSAGFRCLCMRWWLVGGRVWRGGGGTAAVGTGTNKLTITDRFMTCPEGPATGFSTRKFRCEIRAAHVLAKSVRGGGFCSL